ncbi:MAG TPA: TMEM165/GDT1 family protein [Polyangia bacterium]|nr:TMEM165/GDT1 family protein [Polyangia bacterium]
MAAAKLFASIFAVIFVAELPDKTALASLVLATRHRALPVLAGSAAALAIQSLVAVIAGSLLSLLPARGVHIGSGVLFLVSAVLMWRKKEEEAETKDEGGELGFTKAFTMSFMVVFVAEWGDLTQLATASFAARYKQPLLVFCAATAALWAVAAVAVVAGNRAGKLLDPKLTQRIAAVLFALVGVLLIVGIF